MRACGVHVNVCAKRVELLTKSQYQVCTMYTLYMSFMVGESSLFVSFLKRQLYIERYVFKQIFTNVTESV